MEEVKHNVLVELTAPVVLEDRPLRPKKAYKNQRTFDNAADTDPVINIKDQKKSNVKTFIDVYQGNKVLRQDIKTSNTIYYDETGNPIDKTEYEAMMRRKTNPPPKEDDG